MLCLGVPASAPSQSEPAPGIVMPAGSPPVSGMTTAAEAAVGGLAGAARAEGDGGGEPPPRSSAQPSAQAPPQAASRQRPTRPTEWPSY